MYFDSLSVHVYVVKADEILDPTREVVAEYSEFVSSEGDAGPVDDDLLNDVQAFVFREAGRPVAYSVEFRLKRAEQGASSSLGQFVIEVLGSSEEQAWRVLAGAVATYVAGRLSGPPKDDDEPLAMT